jgi:hypothetical protein
LLAVVVQCSDDAQVLVGGDVSGRGLFGPVDHGLNRALLEANVGGAE